MRDMRAGDPLSGIAVTVADSFRKRLVLVMRDREFPGRV
jgi:hypothetical protein